MSLRLCRMGSFQWEAMVICAHIQGLCSQATRPLILVSSISIFFIISHSEHDEGIMRSSPCLVRNSDGDMRSEMHVLPLFMQCAPSGSPWACPRQLQMRSLYFCALGTFTSCSMTQSV